jgi:deoxyribonuclease V
LNQTLASIPNLEECLRDLIAQIPQGQVTTCGLLAQALGNSVAARWVGHFALHHAHEATCCCHRIVRAGGALGGYVTGSIAEKVTRLGEEGVEVDEEHVDWNRFGFDAFRSDRPLETLRKVQESVRSQVVLRAWRRMPKWVAGVDVAYPKPGQATAAYALIETETAELAWSMTVRRPVHFPYITSYLSFREIPILHELLEEVRKADRLAEVLLVDGTGILHPRRAGIAAHLGVLESIPTIGVIKKLLCGKVDLHNMSRGEARPVLLEDEPVGVALCSTAGSQKPIFVSPGHRVNLAFAERLVRRLWAGRRLPEPIYWADRLSKQKNR